MIDFGIFTIDGVKRFLFDALRIDGCEFGDMQLRFRSDEVGTYADVRERLGESLAPRRPAAAPQARHGQHGWLRVHSRERDSRNRGRALAS